jgi:caspase domain-containing protein
MPASALLIGVKETTFGGGRFAPLRAVGRDLARVRSFLGGRGYELFTPRDLRAADVASQLERLVDATGPSDELVVYFTGHGYRYKDDDGDEADGWDEALVCSDDALSDDWFRDLWRRARPGARFIVIIDACHSASAVLGVDVSSTSPGPPAEIAIASPRGYSRLVLAACRDEEVAFQAGRGDDGGGVVTTEMLRALRSDPAIVYRRLWPKVATDVRSRYPESSVGMPTMVFTGPDSALLDDVAFGARPKP